MKVNEINRIVRRGMEALVLAVAFGAAQSARADYWAWNGSSTSPSYWDDLSLWVRSGSNTDFSLYNHNIMEKWSDGKAFATGWDKTVVAVTGDATYKATFSSTKNQYTITWLNDDDSQIDGSS